MTELRLLQALRLKGRVRPAELAATLDTDEAGVGLALDQLTEAGLVTDGKTVRLSPDGRARLGQLLADERRGIDHDAMVRSYQEFRGVNREFKAVVSDWQLRDGAPNDHTDAVHDATVLTRLRDVHRGVLPILTAVTEQVPRLAAYTAKLSAALGRIEAGDPTWFTRPLVDSYHTVWFELHEELIGAAGLTREAEAAAGLDE